MINYITAYTTALSSPELIKLTDQYVNFLTKLANAINKSLFIANDKAVVEIEALTNELDVFKKSVSKFNITNLKTDKNDPSFEPLDSNSAQKLSKVAIDLLTNPKIYNMLNDVIEAIDLVNRTKLMHTSVRLIGKFAKDLRASNKYIDQLSPIMTELLNLMHERNRICFAAMNYIKASSK